MSASLQPAARGWGRERPAPTGLLVPWNPQTDQPVLLWLPEAPRVAVPIFDDEAALRQMMRLAGVVDYSIKQIVEGGDFLDSVEEAGAIVAANPHPTDRGTIRWTWIMSTDQEGEGAGSHCGQAWRRRPVRRRKRPGWEGVVPTGAAITMITDLGLSPEDTVLLGRPGAILVLGDGEILVDAPQGEPT